MSWPRWSSSTRPRASRAPSRTAPSCAATPTRSSRAPSSPPGPWTPGPIVIATKASFTQEIARLRAAIDEMTKAGWTDDLDISIFEGSEEYLYGEETGLLEALDGRPPFPRIAPPYRRGRGRGRRDRRRCHRRQRAGRPRRDGRRRDRRAARARRQRRDDGQRPEDHRPRRGLVPHGGHGPLTGDAGLHDHRRHPPERGRRGPDGDDPARRHPGDRRRAGGGPDHQGRADRRVQRRARARAARHPADLRGHAGRGERAGLGQLPRLRPARRHGRGRRRRGPLPGRRVLRAVHARASRTGWRSRTAWPRSAPAPRPRPT